MPRQGCLGIPWSHTRPCLISPSAWSDPSVPLAQLSKSVLDSPAVFRRIVGLGPGLRLGSPLGRRRFLQTFAAACSTSGLWKQAPAEIILGYAPAGMTLAGRIDLANLLDAPVAGNIHFPAHDGRPRLLAVEGEPVEELSFQLPARGSLRLALQSSQLTTGSLYIPVLGEQDLAVQYTFAYSGDPLPPGGFMTTVNVAPPANQYTLLVRGVPGEVATGIAIHAVDDADVALEYVDSAGSPQALTSIRLTRRTLRQFFVQKLLPIGDAYIGVIRLTANGRIIAQSITQDLRNWSLSVYDGILGIQEREELFFSHLALGGNWPRIRFLLHNPDATPEQGEIRLHHPDGELIAAYSVPAHGTIEEVIGSSSEQVRRYFATVRSNRGPTRLYGSAFFEQLITGWPGTFNTSVLPTDAARAWRMLVVNEQVPGESGPFRYRTGLALLSRVNQDVKVTAYSAAGEPAGAGQISLEADRIQAVFPGEMGLPEVPEGISSLVLTGSDALHISGLDVNFRTAAINSRPALAVQPAELEALPVAFRWFEYSGVDPVFESLEIGPGQYYNPVLAGFYPDPSICSQGEDYYLIHSSFAYFPGIPIFHSRDLINWEQIGHVIHRSEQFDYGGIQVSEGIFAPAITYHEGRYYVVCTMVAGGGNFVTTATDPAGPWSDPVFLHFEGIDPSLFFDEDGRAWIVNNRAPAGPPQYDGHRAIWIQEFDPDQLRMVGRPKLLVDGGVDIRKKPIWIEGPHLYKRNGWYYLCCAEGGTGPGHSQVIFRSRQVDGPYEPWEENPILTQRDLSPAVPGAVTSTGHADLVIGPDGQWWAVFLGVRPYNSWFSPMGRETFLLPVGWTDDDWPVILPPGERVPLVLSSPNGASRSPSPAEPRNGSFTWREEFADSELSHQWIQLRSPRTSWWRVDASAKRLLLTPRRDSLAGRGNPSYLARRVQHSIFVAATAVEIPDRPGVSAGLAVFQNERHHYFLGARRDRHDCTIYLEQARGDEPTAIASARISNSSQISLRVEASNDQCSFRYRSSPDEAWQTLVDKADATLLTSTVAGGFVGATVGPHVRLDPAVNPVVWADVPDPSVIRVGSTYYMSSTTMHLSPGLPILKSKDLVNWELVSYAYDRLAEVDALNLENGRNAYGAGSWASSLRYHRGTFYVSTFSSTTDRTYVFSTREIERGPWKATSFSPALHDNSLLFDDDGRVYMVHGSGDLWLTELTPDAGGLKPGGINQIIIRNASAVAGPQVGLPAEGSQVFKFNGKYYLMNITWPPGDMRTQIVHRAERITGPWEGRVVLHDQGVAQGGLIDTPQGEWFAVLFQDHGAVGRVPFVVPVSWVDGWPVLGVGGKAPTRVPLPAQQSGVPAIVGGDGFDRAPGDSTLPLFWQWNHNPDPRGWSLTDRPGFLRLRHGRVDSELTQTRNTLTQRTFGPASWASVTLDVSGLRDGDCAGLAAFQKIYGFVGVKRESSQHWLVMLKIEAGRPVEVARRRLEQSAVHLRVDCDFRGRTDKAYFYYSLNGHDWQPIGTPLSMLYTLPHFMGYRFALFSFATREPGGFADFDNFQVGDTLLPTSTGSH